MLPATLGGGSIESRMDCAKEARGGTTNLEVEAEGDVEEDEGGGEEAEGEEDEATRLK